MVKGMETDKQDPGMPVYGLQSADDGLEIGQLEVFVFSIPECGRIKCDMGSIRNLERGLNRFSGSLTRRKEGIVARNTTFEDFSIIPERLTDDVGELPAAGKNQVGFAGIRLGLGHITRIQFVFNFFLYELQGEISMPGLDVILPGPFLEGKFVLHIIDDDRSRRQLIASVYGIHFDGPDAFGELGIPVFRQPDQIITQTFAQQLFSNVFRATAHPFADEIGEYDLVPLNREEPAYPLDGADQNPFQPRKPAQTTFFAILLQIVRFLDDGLADLRTAGSLRIWEINNLNALVLEIFLIASEPLRTLVIGSDEKPVIMPQ